MTAQRATKAAPKRRPKAAAKRQGRRPLLLDAATVENFANAVKGGIYPHVAARASGISPRTYFRYMERGRAAYELAEELEDVPAAERPYWQFWHTTEQARAIARASAENRLHTLDPFKWLKAGPGRDRGDPDEPGWTEQVAVTGPTGGPAEVVVRYVNDWREAVEDDGG